MIEDPVLGQASVLGTARTPGRGSALQPSGSAAAVTRALITTCRDRNGIITAAVAGFAAASRHLVSAAQHPDAAHTNTAHPVVVNGGKTVVLR